MFKKILFKNFLWLIIFLFFLFLFSWKIFFKGYLIGPFDFLVGFYHPYLDIQWNNQNLNNAALHYKNYLMSDVVTVVLPIKLFAIETLKKFQFPLWNPYILNGSPLFANIQSAVIYPLNILYFIFNPQWAYNFYILFQLLFAFIFMFLYLQSLKLNKTASYFGSLAFSFSSFFIVWLPWGTLGHAFLWLPLALYAVEKYFQKPQKRYCLLFALSLIFSFFAGHTQVSLIVWALSFFYIFFKAFETKHYSFGLSLIFVYFIAFLISAIQLLPSIDMYQQSARELLATPSFYKDQTLHLSSYLMAISPDFFGNPVTRNWWGKINYAESSIYFGTIAFYFLIYFLLYIIYNYRKINHQFFLFFIIFLLLSIALSVQSHFSYFIFKLKLPLISSSTFARYSIIFIFSSSILAAFGFFKFLEDLKKQSFKLINLNNFLFLILFLSIWFLIFTKFLPIDYINNLQIIKRNMILPSLLIFTVITLSYFYIFINQSTIIKKFKKSILISFVSLIFLILLSFELWRFAKKYTPFSPPDFFYPKHSLIEKLKNITTNERYYNYFPANINTLYQVKGVEGNEPLYNLRLGELASLGKNGNIFLNDRASIQFHDGPYKKRILDLFSVKYFVDKNDNFKNSGSMIDTNIFDKYFKEIWTDGIYKIYENKYSLNRLNLYYKVEYINQKNKIFSRLISNKFNPKETVILEKKLNQKINQKGTYQIKIIKDEPTNRQYEVITSQPGIFMLTDSFYPGWKVFINGQEKEILKANYAFQAVYLNQGKNNIKFIYQPKSFIYGLGLSIFGLLILIYYLSRK